MLNAISQRHLGNEYRMGSITGVTLANIDRVCTHCGYTWFPVHST